MRRQVQEAGARQPPQPLRQHQFGQAVRLDLFPARAFGLQLAASVLSPACKGSQGWFVGLMLFGLVATHVRQLAHVQRQPQKIPYCLLLAP